MKKILASVLTAVLCLCSFASCGLLTPKINRFIPNEQITSVEIKTANYETGIEEITEKYVLTGEQSNTIKSLLNEISYVKRYNILKEKWTHFNDVQYIFTFETQKVCLSENHIYIYDSNNVLIQHVEFNSSTFNDHLEQINTVIKASDFNGTGAPESYFEYGFMDECSDGTKHLKIESFEISTSYLTIEEATNEGLFVVLGVTTNLTESDFTNQNNLVELWLSPSQMINLRFKSFDTVNRKLIYEIPENDDLDYTDLSNLSVSNSNDSFSNLSILLDVFNTYCVVNDTQYCGRYIRIILE